ncbi:MAG: hybrid sensor histidine kinase/response regulator [Myxococcota bacterium]
MDRNEILYVDDEVGNRVVFEAAFGKEFSLVCVDSVDAALAILEERSNRIGVLIADQRMPGRSGNELLREVRERFPGIVRVILTAFSDLDPILNAVNEGLVARYVVKPWDKTELGETLRWALDLAEFSETHAAVQSRLLEHERLATVGTMTKAMLHDLNQPLSNLVLNVGMLAELGAQANAIANELEARSPRLSSEERARLAKRLRGFPSVLEDIELGLGQFDGIVKDARRFSTRQSGTEESILVQPYEAVEYSLRVCRAEAHAARVELQSDVPRVREPLVMSFTQLCQVMVNLMRNAIQAIESSGRGGSVKVVRESSAERVDYQVIDDGPGMESEELERLGKSFFTTREGGSGIGIMQCHRLVGMAGGRFWLESTPGKGTTAHVEVLRA